MSEEKQKLQNIRTYLMEKILFKSMSNDTKEPQAFFNLLLSIHCRNNITELVVTQ